MHNNIKKFLKKIIIPCICACVIIPGTVSYATNIQQLEQQQESAAQDLANKESQMVELMVEIQSLEEDIAQNESDIAETEQNLLDAMAAEELQYQQMSLRIKYMYENQNTNVFSVLLSSTSFSDFLNQLEYANSVYTYDKQMLDSCEATRIEIQEIKADLETQKVTLAAKQEQLSAKKISLQSLIDDAKARKQDIDSELAEARAEAARRAAAEAAAREAARAAARAAANAASANAAASNVTNANPAPRTNVSGGSVVSYANQFVGNPYVWGGNSLTNGVDCSGFVVEVYKHFGINLSGSRNSAALRSVGQAVSYDHMQPGDIVCYSGHVGIYTGAGTIVEAQSSRAGITNNRSVNNRTILAIRRVI